ncbi:hypothetical protein PBY51_023551 [Eleginops maclovinus]|uniref:Uncharacterized protein n=1 Tax=Eleginops maclovinus TaxID=56733 RepID=A0AAN7WZ05_ELEMC|nr:hypothetical protein PBY51_023551 [Eleginops maclovinus]
MFQPQRQEEETRRGGESREEMLRLTQWTYWVHPQGVYECVGFGSGKRVCLAVSVVVEVTWERGLRKGTERGEGSGVEEARK